MFLLPVIRPCCGPYYTLYKQGHMPIGKLYLSLGQSPGFSKQVQPWFGSGQEDLFPPLAHVCPSLGLHSGTLVLQFPFRVNWPLSLQPPSQKLLLPTLLSAILSVRAVPEVRSLLLSCLYHFPQLWEFSVAFLHGRGFVGAPLLSGILGVFILCLVVKALSPNLGLPFLPCCFMLFVLASDFYQIFQQLFKFPDYL